MSNPQEGNRIILLGLAIALAMASLFVQWGVITVSADMLRESMTINGQKVGQTGMDDMFGGMMSSMMSGMQIPVSGLNGNLVLGPLKIPYWLTVVAVIAGIVFIITNSRQVSAVPQKLVFALLGFGVITAVWASVVMLTSGTIGLGAFLLLGASIIGFTQQRGTTTLR
jgi:hypothetical protein